jgi:hypothetical protein
MTKNGSVKVKSSYWQIKFVMILYNRS